MYQYLFDSSHDEKKNPKQKYPQKKKFCKLTTHLSKTLASSAPALGTQTAFVTNPCKT